MSGCLTCGCDSFTLRVRKVTLVYSGLFDDGPENMELAETLHGTEQYDDVAVCDGCSRRYSRKELEAMKKEAGV